MGPRGLSPQQTAYWESAVRKATALAERKADLEKNYWSDDFAASEQFRKDLDSDSAAMKAVMMEFGSAKQ